MTDLGLFRIGFGFDPDRAAGASAEGAVPLLGVSGHGTGAGFAGNQRSLIAPPVAGSAAGAAGAGVALGAGPASWTGGGLGCGG